jgi:prolyl oligopeptidase
VVGLAVPARAGDYPEARRDSQVDDYFGEKVTDPYRWMEATDSAETQAWVAAEREHTAAALKAIPARAAIRGRLRELWNYPKYGLPDHVGGRLFFTRNSGLQNQPVVCVIDRPGAAPRVLIDPNLLAADGTVAVTAVSPSHDGRLVGYGVATAGSDWNEFHVRDVASGKDLPDVVRWVKFSGLSWTRDGKGFFYDRYPESHRGDKLFGTLSGRQTRYHLLGTAQAADRLIYERKDHPDWFASAGVTDDGRYLVLNLTKNGEINNAVLYADLGDPLAPKVDAPIDTLLGQFDAQYTVIGNAGSVFYLESTLQAPHGMVVAIDTANPTLPWKSVVPQGDDALEQEVLAGGKLAVLTIHDVQSHLTVYALDGAGSQEIPLPGGGKVEGLAGYPDDPALYYSFESFLTPPSILSLDLESGQVQVFQQPATPFDRSPYETRQVFFPSKDGTRIPMYLTARKGLKLDGTAPLWLYGYGGFEVSLMPEYAPARSVWLEMGGVYAQVNLRGGGEYGDAWHRAGTKEHKQNVFDDFIAAADTLVAQGYTRRDRLVIEGRSNGGLLIGAVLNQRPDLCAVALPTVGVMDMLRYHTFTVGAAWAGDYGTSEDPVGFRYLRAYSPVHNVRAGVRYPAVLIMTGDHDDRVFPAHSYKYAAAMQYEAGKVQGSGPILIRIEPDAGHGGSTGTSPASKTIAEWADKIGFVVAHFPAGTLVVPAVP